MQPWNQWGVQATTGYTLPGYPAAMPSPVVSVAPTVSSLPYTMGGYQWPSYSATNVTPTVGGAWPVQNQQQQWDQWTQWQQQYAQWQQEYGDKYMQSVQQSTQASSTTGATVPVGVPPTTATAGGDEKRGAAASGPPDAKKAKTEENSAEAIKDVLKEMAEAEKQFDEQFNNWEVQFNTWREQNASHPDTEQYKAYEAKWKSWRNQLLQRREQMRKKRTAKMAELAKLEQQPSTSYSATGTVGLTASMSVPPPTLGATSVASASVTPAVTPAVLPSTAVPPPGMTASGGDSTNPYALYNTSFYNQQGGYMFGSTPYGVPPVFPPVPPPVVAPTNTSAPPPNSSSTVPSTTSAGVGEAGQNKPVDNTSSNNTAISGSNKPSDPQSGVNFSQPPPSSTTQGSSGNNGSQNSSDSGGIPGLDLLNHPPSSQSSKQPDFNPTSTSSLIPKQQEIIQTPADSKPFDFPSPAKNQNTSVPPPSMMNFPPPGYLNPTFKVFQMGTNPNPGLLPSKHNPNKELVEALMNTIETNPGTSQDGRNQNYNMNRQQRSDYDPKGNNVPPGSGQDFRGNQMNNFPPPNNFSDNQWGGNQTANKAPLLPTPSLQGFNPSGKQGDIPYNNNMPPFNQPPGYKNNDGSSNFRNDGPSPRFGGPQGFRGNDGPPGFRGNDGPPSSFKNDGFPQGFRPDGLPPDFRSDGPPPNFRNDGPPNYRNDGSQNFRNDGPHNFRGNDGMRQNGPPGFRGNDCGPSYRGGSDGGLPSGFRDGPPPGYRDGPGFRNDGFRGDNIRSNDGHGSDNFRGNNYRKDDFDRPPYMNDDNYSFGKGSDKNREEAEGYNQDFNDNRSDRGRNDYNDESFDNHSDDRGPLGNQRDFRYPPAGSDSQDRGSFNDGDGSLFGRHAFGPNARPGGGPPPLMGSGVPPIGGAQGGPLGVGGQAAARFQQLPPLHNPDKIIDYIHKPANLGFPAFYEPVTMIDYAHGAHKLPEGEEDRFPPGENRDIFPKDDDFDGRLHGPGRGPSPFRSRNERRRGPWGTRESRWERDSHGSPARRDEGRSRDREDRGRDDRRDSRDGREDRHDRDRRDDRDRDSRRDSRRDDRRDDRRDRDSREDKRDERGDSPRREERWRHDKSSRHDDDRFKDERKDRDRSSDKSKDSSSKRNSLTKTRSPTPPSRSMKEESSLKAPPENTSEVTHNPVLLVDDILLAPGRERRPPRIVVILRGPPGSGKTYVAKLMKDKEVEMGGSAPRILSLDDYFMVESEKEEVDKDTGRSTTVKAMEYEYESGMEPHYRESLIKAFRKTIIDGYFPFIIVDCINDKLNHFEELSSFAKQKGFQVYICEMDLDISLCVKRNVHKRSEEEIKNIVNSWEKTPLSETILDVRSLLQSASITEVNMEDSDPIEDMPEEVDMEDVENKRGSDAENKNDENSSKLDNSSREDLKDDKDSKSADNDEVVNKGLLASALSSKWDDLDSSYNKLDRLDGLSKARRATSIKDWLQLPEDYFETSQSSAVPGKKRVRWADLEERREQEKMRAIGFVVGQTDWIRMLDPSGGQSKLTQTKYI